MKMGRWITIFYLMTIVPSLALAVTRSPRTPPLEGTRVLLTTALQGGAVEAVLSVSEVRGGSRSIVDGTVQETDADVLLRLDLHAQVNQVLGLRNAGEFIPYQGVRARLENLSTHDVTELALVPHVSSAAGWSYASNVRLPPADRMINPFQDGYRVTIQISSQPALVLHEDVLPPSSLWRSNGFTTIMIANVRLGPVQALPITGESEVTTQVEAFGLIRSSLSQSAFDDAVAQYALNLESFFQGLEDATQYGLDRRLTAPLLADVDENVANALLRREVRGECNGNLPECRAWANEALHRGFVLGVIRDLDDAVTATSSADAVRAWDQGYVLHLPLRSMLLNSELACLTGAPQEPALLDCAMVTGVDDAFISGANAMLLGNTAGAAAARDIIVTRVLKSVYYTLARLVTQAVRTGEQGPRVAAHAAFITLWHLLPYSERVALERVLADRGTLTEVEARDFFLTFNPSMMDAGLNAAELIHAEDLLEVLP